MSKPLDLGKIAALTGRKLKPGDPHYASWKQERERQSQQYRHGEIRIAASNQAMHNVGYSFRYEESEGHWTTWTAQMWLDCNKGIEPPQNATEKAIFDQAYKAAIADYKAGRV